MDKERAQEVQRLFHEALERLEPDRQALIAQVSSADPEMSSLLKDLLRVSSEAVGFLSWSSTKRLAFSVGAGIPSGW